MTSNESHLTPEKKALIKYWMEKSRESLESAYGDLEAGRLSPAVRSAYYACFYALSAILWSEGKTFKKHSGVRGALHRYLVKPGKIDASWGRFYDIIFDSRHRGDYHPMVRFDPEQVEGYIDRARDFVKQMESLIKE